MRLEKLHLDCASSAPSHHGLGSTQQWPLLHREDYLRQGSEILAVISPTARLGQMVTISPRRLAEQPLRFVTPSSNFPSSSSPVPAPVRDSPAAANGPGAELDGPEVLTDSCAILATVTRRDLRQSRLGPVAPGRERPQTPSRTRPRLGRRAPGRPGRERTQPERPGRLRPGQLAFTTVTDWSLNHDSESPSQAPTDSDSG
jgi:hypothetical protein